MSYVCQLVNWKKNRCNVQVDEKPFQHNAREWIKTIPPKCRMRIVPLPLIADGRQKYDEERMAVWFVLISKRLHKLQGRPYNSNFAQRIESANCSGSMVEVCEYESSERLLWDVQIVYQIAGKCLAV